MTPWLSCDAFWLAFSRVVLDVMQWLQLAFWIDSFHSLPGGFIIV